MLPAWLAGHVDYDSTDLRANIRDRNKACCARRDRMPTKEVVRVTAWALSDPYANKDRSRLRLQLFIGVSISAMANPILRMYSKSSCVDSPDPGSEKLIRDNKTGVLCITR